MVLAMERAEARGGQEWPPHKSAMLHPTILIADDDRRLRESLSEVFNDLGCTTRTAGSGGGAIEVLRQTRCDLLLSDVDMPDMTGFALLSWVSATRVRRRAATCR